MESRSYGESHDFGYSSRSCGESNSYGYSSESRNCGESHEIGYSSESRGSGESHGYNDSVGYGDPSESHDYGESHEVYQPIYENSNKKSDHKSVNSYDEKVEYNSLDDIDKLIENLEQNLPSRKTKNVRYNAEVSRRRQQIKELKKLRAEAQAQKEEQEMAVILEKENDEVDEKINKVKQFLKKYTEQDEEDYPF